MMMTPIGPESRQAIAAIIACIAIGNAMPAAATTRALTAQPTGLWINPAHSVQVVTATCGTALCGWIAWADRKAVDDARDGGVAQLTGTEILEDCHRLGQGKWQGRVRIPDMGRTFSSTLTLVDADRLKVSGCVLGGFLCKSQVWTRTGHP